MPHDKMPHDKSVQVDVEVQISRSDPSMPLPRYHYPGDAGLDLRAAEDCILQPSQRKTISTGLKVAIPAGYAGFVLPRSGLAAKAGLSLVNSPGLIDSQYRGELCVIAINLDPHEPIVIKKGDRVAQLVILSVPRVELTEVKELNETVRSGKGFGSSGLV
jgi:dUTP pyrophosphatase